MDLGRCAWRTPVDRKGRAISHRCLHWAGVITILQALPVALWATGLVFLWPWMTAFGLVGSVMAKFAFLDQMARTYGEATA